MAARLVAHPAPDRLLFHLQHRVHALSSFRSGRKALFGRILPHGTWRKGPTDSRDTSPFFTFEVRAGCAPWEPLGVRVGQAVLANTHGIHLPG